MCSGLFPEDVMNNKQAGFSLIELLIAVTIVALVMGFAVSAYQGQIQSSRRAEMQGQMMSLATSLETWRSQNFTYAGATVPVLAPDVAASNHYAVNIVLTNNNQSYELVAIPSGDMVGSGQMRLDSQGRSCFNPASDTACDLADTNLRWGRK